MGRGAALYDQFTGVIGVKRGSFAKDEEPDDAQAEWLEKTQLRMTAIGNQRPFPFFEDEETARRRVSLVRWWLDHDEGYQSIENITKNSGVYGNKISLLDKERLTKTRQRKALCKGDIEALKDAGLCRSPGSAPESAGVYKLEKPGKWPNKEYEIVSAWLQSYAAGAGKTAKIL